jgi:hypothetical protein
MHYSAYLFDSVALQLLQDDKNQQVRLDTPCGIEHAAVMLKSGEVQLATLTAATAGAGSSDAFISHSFKSLQSKTGYTAVVLATCDASCLRQHSKTAAANNRGWISCSGTVDCQSQSLVYSSFSFSTTAEGNDDDDNSGGSGSNSGDSGSLWDSMVGHLRFVLIFSAVVAVLFVLALLLQHYKKVMHLLPAASSGPSRSNRQGGSSGELGVGIAMTDLVNSAKSVFGSSSSGSGSSSSHTFSPLPTDSSLHLHRSREDRREAVRPYFAHQTSI